MKDGTLFARQQLALLHAVAALVSRLAGTKKKRNELAEITEAMARLTASIYGPNSQRLVDFLALCIKTSPPGVDATESYERQLRVHLSGEADQPDVDLPAAPDDSVARLLSQFEEPRPAPKRTRRKPRKGGEP